MKILKIIPIFMFVFCFFTVYSFINGILEEKSWNYGYFSGFYKIEKNSVDVICLGSSTTSFSINPVLLWRNNGIPAVDLVCPVQSFPIAYYYLKEALKYQKPKLIILDTLACWNSLEGNNQEEYWKLVWVLNAKSGMKLSANKIGVVLRSRNNRLDLFLGLPMFHQRRNINKNDITKYLKPDINYMNGYTLISSSEIVIYPPNDFEYTNTTGIVEQSELEYLTEIIELTKKEKIQIIFYEPPHIKDNEIQMQYNVLHNIASENGIEYIDYNKKYIELNLSGQTDFMNKSHLNYSGANKLTENLGNYIKKAYNLQDHRNEEKYNYWKKWAKDCYKIMKEQQ